MTKPDFATLEMVMVFSFPLWPLRRDLVLRHWYWNGGRKFTFRLELAYR